MKAGSSKKVDTYRKYYQDQQQVDYYLDMLEKPISKAFTNAKQEELEKAIKEKFENRKINTLDIACGYGRMTCFLEKFSKQIYGVDVSNEMMRIAKKKCKKTRFLKYDLTKKELPEKFDLITAFRYFVNAKDDERKSMMLSARKMIKKDGLFIFNIHKNKTPLTVLFKLFQKLFMKKDVNLVSQREARKLVEGLFEIKQIIPLDYFGFSKLSIRNKNIIRLIIKLDSAAARILPAKCATNNVYVCTPCKTSLSKSR